MSLQAGNQYQEKLDAAIECLVGCLHSREGSIRESVRKCLVFIGQLAVPALIQALDSSHREARWEAAKALGEIGDPRAAKALVKTLGHDQFAIRWLAAEALIGLERQGLEPLLLALLHNPDSGFLRDGAHHVLHALRDADSSLREILSPLVDALEAFAGAEDVIPHAEAVLNAVIGNSKEAHGNELKGES